MIMLIKFFGKFLQNLIEGKVETINEGTHKSHGTIIFYSKIFNPLSISAQHYKIFTLAAIAALTSESRGMSTDHTY